ncbi:MAG TPA: hypothetical protein VFS19_03755 [Planctomycetota bacterium]|nr:hypothetical protein [Planctomycetota bacterium]
MSERQMTILLFIVMGGIILIGGGWLYYLRFQEMAQLEEDLAKTERDLKEARDKSAKLPKLREEKKSLIEKIEQIRSQIPLFNPREENDQFADLVGSLEKKSRVNLTDVRYSAVRTGHGGEALPASIFRARYELKVTGGFFQLLTFMNLLETERRFLVVDNIKLLSGSAADKPGVAPVRELQMNLSTFMQRPTPTPVAAAGPPKPLEKPAELPPEERRPSTPIPD